MMDLYQETFQIIHLWNNSLIMSLNYRGKRLTWMTAKLLLKLKLEVRIDLSKLRDLRMMNDSPRYMEIRIHHLQRELWQLKILHQLQIWRNNQMQIVYICFQEEMSVLHQRTGEESLLHHSNSLIKKEKKHLEFHRFCLHLMNTNHKF